MEKFSTLTNGLRHITSGHDPDISGVSSDTSSCKEGDIFVCIEGMRSDSHEMINDAIAKGAAAFVISANKNAAASRLLEAGIPFAVSDDTRSAEAVVLSRFHGDPWKKIKMFAVTGTNGKTTVVSLLSAIYRAAGYNCRTVGTLTGKLTTPDPAELYPMLAQYASEGTDYVFMEASSHALALGKLAPIRFDTAVFTNLTPEHLDFHKTMEAYAEAKAKLFDNSDKAILNRDDRMSQYMSGRAGNTFLCSASDENSDFTAKYSVSKGARGVEYDLYTKDRIIKIKSPIPGTFTVMNTLEAASAALCDGIPQYVIRSAICGFRGVKGRLEKIELPTNDFSVYIDFAHTPDALENILRTVRGFITKDQRLTLVFGCGGDRDKSKRRVMGGIASGLADRVIVTSDNSRGENTADIISDIVTGIDDCTYTVIEDRKEAIEYAIFTAKQGDVILLTGKGHEEYQITQNGTVPFSERKIAYEAAERRIKNNGTY